MTNEQQKAIEEVANEKANKFFPEKGEARAIFHSAISAGMEIVTNSPERYGLQPVNQWISVKERLPLAWESGDWDGKRSEEVLIMKTDNRYTIGRVYHGVMDGSVFTDWSEGKEEWLIDSSEVTHWQPIPQPPTDIEPK